MKRTLLFLLWCVLAANAHLNSPDVFTRASAGPYHLQLTIRPAAVVPGVAQIQVETDADVTGVSVTPLPIEGEAAKHPPTPEALVRSAQAPNTFSGNIWIMASGSWQVRFDVNGKGGTYQISVPLSSAPIVTKPMSAALGFGLALFGVVLIAGAISIVGAAAREAQLTPGRFASAGDRHRARVAQMFAALVFAVVLLGGASWWSAEARTSNGKIYRPPRMNAAIDSSTLQLHLVPDRRLDDLVPDHGHLMHLYALRLPEMDRIYHLHPEQTAVGSFALSLPSMPAGSYRLFADIVHANGFPETISTVAELPTVTRRPLIGDDAGGEVTPLHHASDAAVYVLPDGYSIVWKRPAVFHARQASNLNFELKDPSGNPASDCAPYMGMAAHAAVVKHDETVFAHLHPLGTVNMAAWTLAQSPDSAHDAHQHSVEPEVEIPYGFPMPGKYRVIVQMKHSDIVETAVFDTNVYD
ncbi:MAG: hypothetical protein JOZ43_03625 [Acidobacteriales bacterium]|nr:hypothetical protein [Terriglobales bacterium]